MTVPADLHVTPVSDLREHEETRACWCAPRLVQDDPTAAVIVVHHSADGRELVEEHGIQ